MPNSIDVTIYPHKSEDVIEVRDVQFLSLVNGNTYGKPAIISDAHFKEDGLGTILYINPENVVAIEATRNE